MAAAPAAVTAAAPAHLVRREMFHLLRGGQRGTGSFIRRRQPSVFCERMRCKWRGPRARGQRGRARGKSKSELQKMAAFHDISLSVRASDARESLIASR